MQSMTGWGRGYISRDGREMTLEMKSVNHRFLDLNFRIPRSLSFLEDAIRGWIKDSDLRRGHIEITLNYTNTRSDARSIHIDTGRLKAFEQAMEENNGLALAYTRPTLAEVMQLCEAVTVTEVPEETETVTALAKDCFDAALQTMREMRQKEGQSLAKDLLANVALFSALRDKIAEKAPSVPANYQRRLSARLEELGVQGADPARLAQEVAIMADRCAIDEELSRLVSHIGQFRDTVLHQEEAGKRLDFLLQEMNRETNTIGSKASDLEIAQAVVDGKCILEKLREQVQNIV